MQKEEFNDKNPLRILNRASDGSTVTKRMGLVMARAGLGKTAILVQLAMESIFRGNKVIHVSIGQTLDKTRVWYDDILKDMATETKLENATEVHTELMRNRMIMTFNASGFSRAKLEERLNDLIEQDVFKPNCLVIDGLDFSAIDRAYVEDLRQMMMAMNLNLWFSAVSHRDDTRTSPIGVPAPCHEMDDLFDTVILIQPQADRELNKLVFLKDGAGCIAPGTQLDLDPVTMMIK